jgi:hypothetical protein
LAFGTGWNVTVFEIAAHIWPIVLIPERLVSLVETEMAECVMGQTEQGFAYGSNLWDDETIANVPEAITLLEARNTVSERGEFGTPFVGGVTKADGVQKLVVGGDIHNGANRCKVGVVSSRAYTGSSEATDSVEWRGFRNADERRNCVGVQIILEWHRGFAFRIGTLVKISAGQRIGDGIIFALDIDDFGVELSHEFHPAGLTSGQIALVVEIF